MKTAPRALAGPILILVALAALTVSASAAAAPGWRLPIVTSQQGEQVFTSKARHCGASQFGSYVFRNGVKGPQRSGFVVFRVPITPDGVGHRAVFKRFGGNLSRAQKAQTRQLLNQVTFRYAAGPPARVETVRPDGSVQASRAFNPVPKTC
jgi:hypothetical protein